MNITDLIYIILGVLLIIILIIFKKYNQLIKLQNRVKKAKANIEIYLNKRFDLIPNLVECVKNYAKYESETLEDIVSLRNHYINQKNLNIKQAEAMNDRLNEYLVVVENYPNLKADTGYLNLQKELKEVETNLEKARHVYNDEVTKYNTQIETIPSNVVASIFAFKKTELFQVEERKRENININL